MVSTAATSLGRPVRPSVVLAYGGRLLLVLAALTAVPVVVSALAGEYRFTWRLAVVTGAVGGAGSLVARRAAPASVRPNESIVIAASMFVVTPALMAWPLTAGGLGWADALFEAVSGVTTTGLSVIEPVADAPRTVLFLRAWMQWYGGLGIAALAVALLIPPGTGAAARRLTMIAADEGDLVGSTRTHARRIFVAYVVVTAASIALLWATGGALGDATLHALAAVSTGGFSPHDDSLGAAPLAAQVATILVCVGGATPLLLVHRLARRELGAAAGDLQWLGLAAAIAIVTIAVGATMRGPGDFGWSTVLHHAPLLAASAQTTAGFSTIPPGELDPASKLVLCLSMLVGGGFGSTAGGVKILRMLILLRVLHAMIVRTCLPPHAVLEPTLGRRVLGEREIHAAVVVILLFVGTVALSWLPFLAAGYDPLDALFEVVSAVGTVGLSTGLVGAELPAALKAVLIVDMLLGRLEIFVLLVLVAPHTWIPSRGHAT